MTTIQSASDARNTTIFVIENGKTEETNLYDHVMESAERVTSPRGISTKLFIDEVNGAIFKHKETGKEITEDVFNDLDDDEADLYDYSHDAVIAWVLKEWVGGQIPYERESFDNEEDAENELYTRVYDHDFMNGDQRDTLYWYTREEAEKELADRNAE